MGLFGSRRHRLRSARRWAADFWSEDLVAAWRATDAFAAMGDAASQDLLAELESATHCPPHGDRLRETLRETNRAPPRCSLVWTPPPRASRANRP